MVMPSIPESIEQLSKFEEREDVSTILSEISNLETSTEIDEATSESLRSKLSKILSDDTTESVKKDSLSLADAAYNALLALAELKPINEEDPILLTEIAPGDRVVVSTGHQFDIKSLIKYHDTRDYRGSTLHETSVSKWLINPITNAMFSARDVAHIQSTAATKGILIQNLKTKEDTVPHAVRRDTGHTRGFFTSRRTRRSRRPRQSATRWRKSTYDNDWQLRDSGTEMNRSRDYRNDNPTHIKAIHLYGYTDGTYSIGLEAGHNAGMGWAMPTIEHNTQLIRALQNNSIYSYTDNVDKYPDTDSRFHNYFSIRASADEIRDITDRVLAVVENLEGVNACETIREEILALFTPDEPRLDM